MLSYRVRLAGNKCARLHVLLRTRSRTHMSIVSFRSLHFIALPRCASYTLTITEEGELLLGGIYELTCSIQNLQSGKQLSWRKNNNQLTTPISSPSISLTLNPLKQSDAGTYLCTLTSIGDTTLQQEPLSLMIPRKLFSGVPVAPIKDVHVRFQQLCNACSTIDEVSW